MSGAASSYPDISPFAPVGVPHCQVEVVTKGGEARSFAFEVGEGFDFDRWWFDRWSHEPMLKVSESEYVAFDAIARITHAEHDATPF